MKLERDIAKDEYAHLHDLLYDLTDKHFSNEKLDEIIERLPSHLKAEGFEWGFSDTCVRDQIYVWYKDNVISVGKE